MKVVFLDLTRFDYSPATPNEQPLGGGHSAVCYLAVELAKAGHDIALVNNIRRPGIYEKIACPGRAVGITANYLNQFDAVVVCSSAHGHELRSLGVSSRLILWTQHATNQRAMAALQGNDERAAWDAFVMVSAWQTKDYVKTFDLPSEKIKVLKNAVAPRFESLMRARAPFFLSDSPPLLVYTSTPFRGLDVLLKSFPSIRAAIPGCRLKVYSSMKVYQVSPDKDEHQGLYDLCRTIDGAEYIGSVPQPRLASALSEADILAYPSTFEEMACISVMEAMAAGCVVVTSKLGALSETLAGYGFLMEPRVDVVEFANEYARAVVELVKGARQRPDMFLKIIEEERKFVRANYVWASRACEWEQWLRGIIAEAHGS